MKKKSKTIWDVRGVLKIPSRKISLNWNKARAQVRAARVARQVAILNESRRRSLRAPDA